MKNHRKFGGVLLFLLCSFVFAQSNLVYATPPGSAYTPGETLSPGCAPGASNCTVKPYAVSAANSDITSLTGLTTPLTVGQGGTGTTSLTSNAILLGNGTSGLQTATSGSAYQIFRTPSSGGIPSFGSIDLSQSAAVTGALGATNGGLGLSSAPTYGKIPVGNASGGYTLTSTSSLGLLSSIGGSDTYIQFNNAGSLGGSSAFTFNNTAGRLTSTYASTTAISSGYASSTSLFAGALSVGSLSGFLKATAGSVATSLINLASDITGTLPISSGGTGSVSTPSYGQILVGNNSGGYTLTATSSLGIIAGSVGGSDTQVQYNNAGSFAGNAALLFNSTAGRLTSTYASTTGMTSSYASSTNLFSGTLSTGSLSVGSLSGFLKATAGSVATSFISLTSDVTGTLPVGSGGTGSVSTPSYGQLLVGNNAGGYTLTATSSLGLIAGSIGGSDTQVQYNSAGSFAGNAGLLFNSTAGRLTATYASTTAISSGYASSTSLFAGSLSVGSLSGFLKATAGSVATSLIDLASDATGFLGVTNGGTGTSTAFTTGSILFATTSGAFSQNSSKFFWTDATSRLSVVGTVAGTHLKGLGSTPSISAGTGAGIGGLTDPVVSVSGTDTAGTITMTSGNGVLATGATVATITFASGYGSAPYVILTPANAVTALLSGVTSVFVGTVSTSNFIVTSGTSALTLLTQYKWNYQVIE